MSEDTAAIDALRTAAQTANTAIFTYGVITAFAGASQQDSIGEFTAEIRARRDELNTALTELGQKPAHLEPGYSLPVAPTDAGSSAQLALDAEEEMSVAYLSLIEQADEKAQRRLGVDGLSGCALRACHWRAALEISPITITFPGTA